MTHVCVCKLTTIGSDNGLWSNMFDWYMQQSYRTACDSIRGCSLISTWTFTINNFLSVCNLHSYIERIQFKSCYVNRVSKLSYRQLRHGALIYDLFKRTAYIYINWFLAHNETIWRTVTHRGHWQNRENVNTPLPKVIRDNTFNSTNKIHITTAIILYIACRNWLIYHISNYWMFYASSQQNVLFITGSYYQLQTGRIWWLYHTTYNYTQHRGYWLGISWAIFEALYPVSI